MSRNRVLADMRWKGAHGIGRFADEIFSRIPEISPLKTSLPIFHALDPLLLSLDVQIARPDVFFTPGFNAPLFSAGRLVLTVHDLNYVAFPDNSDPWRRAYFRSVVRPACRRAFRVLTVSEFSRAEIIAWAGVDPDHVVNVGNGVGGGFTPQGNRFEPGFPYLLVVGSVGAHKNILRLLQAFRQSGLTSEMKLMISGARQSAIDNLARTLDIESSIVMLGHVPESELPALYRGATALCMPSLFEGFGLPVIEAMACGVPVLASSSTSLPEVAGDAALLVDPRSVDSISDGLKRIVLDSLLRTTIAERGIARSARFSWERTAELVREALFS